MEKPVQRPPWLDDETELRALLGAFLDKLDARPIEAWKQAPTLKVDARRLPGLFRNDEAADTQWALLKSLHGRVLEIVPAAKRGPFDPEYVGARLRLRRDAEPVLRDWLGRPREVPYAEQWREAVERLTLPGAIAARPARVPGKTALEVAEAFARIGDLAPMGFTLRRLSARCFWGDSKFLDAREDLLLAAFPDLLLQPRPVLVHVRPAAGDAGVLFVENQDTYTRAIAGHPGEARELTLVYVAGYRGSAERIRRREGASLHYHGVDGPPPSRFEQWWFEEVDVVPRAWFWGDLDFAGMAILKMLCQRFGEVHAWEPGYRPMLRSLEAGKGHSPEMTAKQDQTDPGATGCLYADTVLLPAMRACGAFVDQEAV